MSSSTINIKSNNHKVYPCPINKKLELINKIIAENPNTKIIVISSQALDLSSNIPVMSDKEFILDTELNCELLISYDLPQKPAIYQARVAKATQKAVILLDESEQKELYPIEMLLGRAIKQEIIEGFEYEKRESTKTKSNYKKLSAEEIKDVAKKRYDAKVNTLQSDKEEKKEKFKKPTSSSKKTEDKNYHKKGNSKAKNSTKPKKNARKINIKSLNKPKD